jgi:hypothetical protein
MNAHPTPHHHEGISLGQAALIAGLGLLIMTIAAPFAEFFVYSKLVAAGDIETTSGNIRAQGGLYLAGIFAYLLVFIMDVVVAWALYVLLIPVNRSLSLLTAWFRLVYRSAYIPRILGVLLAIAGLCWVVYELAPFLLPGADLGLIFFTFMGETFFMLWLLIRGWKIREPAPA